MDEIKSRRTYVSESLASRMLGESVQEVRRKIQAGELKGIQSTDGNFSVQSDVIYLIPKTVASLIKVQEKHVFEWINSGKLKAIKEGDSYKVSYAEYTRFGQSGQWMPQFHDTAFEHMKKLVNQGQIMEEVNEGFRRGMEPHIIKAREVIEYLEKIHSSCDQKLDVLKGRSTVVAVYVITAKVISILHSTLNLIEKSELIGASSLFRTIYEGVDLINYFLFAGDTKKGQKDLKKWFEGEHIKNPTCSAFFIDFCRKNNFDTDGKMKQRKDELYDGYCKLVHLNYPVIMESYNAMASRGFGQLKVHRMGFDYKDARLMRRAVPFLTNFEALLDSFIVMFILCQTIGLPFEQEHLDKLREYHEFYSKDVIERIKILKQENKEQNKKLGLGKRLSAWFQKSKS